MENRSRYESAQVDLMVYLKWIIVLIGVAIVVLLLKALFFSPPAAPADAVQCSNESYLDQAKNYFYDLFFGSDDDSEKAHGSAKTATMREANTQRGALDGKDDGRQEEKEGGFWRNLLPSLGFGCDSWKSLHDKMLNQRYSVRPTLPDLPSVEAIKANPARFNVSMPHMTALPTSELKGAHPPDQILHKLAKIAQVSPENPKASLMNDSEKVKNAEKNLGDKPQSDLRLKLNDLNGSFKSMAAKKGQIANLYSKFEHSLKDLNKCESEEADLNLQLAAEREVENKLKEDLKSNESMDAMLKAQIEEKEKTLSDGDRKHRKRAVDLAGREKELKAALDQRPFAEKQMQEKLARATAADAEADKIEKNYQSDLGNKSALERELKTYTTQRDDLNRQLEEVTRFISISEEAISKQISREELKKMIEGITDPHKRATIGKKLDEHLSDDKVIVNEVFGDNSKEGRDLKEFIDKNEQQIKTVLNLYDSLSESLKTFKGGEISIEATRKQITQYRNQQKELQKELADLDRKIADLKARLDRLNLALGAKGSRDKELRDEARSAREWVEKKRLELEGLEQQRAALAREIKELEEEQQAHHQSVNSRFGNLDAQRNLIREEHKNILLKLGELVPKVKALEAALEKKRSDCAALKGFYKKTAELVPVLREHFDADRKTLSDLKDSVMNIVGEFVNL